MHLYIARHGQSMGNTREDSGSDPALTELGFAQAASLGARLSRRRFDAIIASPLRRALSTANEVAVRQPGGPAPVLLLPELMEVGTDPEYRLPPHPELTAFCPTAVPYPVPGPLGLTDSVNPDDGDGAARAYAAADFLRKAYPGPDDHILVVAHGTFNSRFLSAALGLEYPFFMRFASPNATLSHISYTPEEDGSVRIRLQFHNDISHLINSGLHEDRL